MSDSTPSGFDAVAQGPNPSETLPEKDRGLDPSKPSGHPSVDALRERFGDAVVRAEVMPGNDYHSNQYVVYVRPERNHEILQWLRDEPAHRYAFLSDVTAVDFGKGRPLEVVYNIFSLENHLTLRVKCELPLAALEIRSVVDLWAAANWLEREVYDLFGIEFEKHPDLRRIMMPENYAEGHPLRKDFPLRGRFSRAEQTRRALSQDPDDYYIPAEVGEGREPQVVPAAVPDTDED
jgi:NADH-quinone oxidoreductase subunit C